MIKLIVSDIDGTLVEDGGNVLNPEYFDVITKLKRKGIHFAAASGRQAVSIERLFEPVRNRIFYLSDNGSIIGIYGRTLYAFEIDKDLVRELVRDVKKRDDLELLLCTDGNIYADTEDEEFLRWMIEGYKFAVEKVEDLLLVEDKINKVSIYRKDDVQAATMDIQGKYGDRLKMAVAGDMWLDCMMPGINKGNAVKTLQEALDIKPEETMVFGDQLNDLEMLDMAYYSFAIGNARPEVKEKARFMADTNSDDGVLKILKMLL